MRHSVGAHGSGKLGDVMTAVILIMVLFLTGCNSPSESHHPSDKQLLQNFQQHEADFNRLLRMASDDVKAVRISKDFTWLDNNMSWPRPDSELGFSRERWDDYRKLFKELGLTAGITRREDIANVVFFVASDEGAALRGTEKGYAYSPQEPHPLVESLDRIEVPMRNMVPVYKRLKGAW